MSTVTQPAAAAPAPAPAVESHTPSGSNLSFIGLVRSEWIKMRSVRSTPWSYGLFVVVSLAITALMALSTNMLIESSGGMGGLGSLAAEDQASIVLQPVTYGVFIGQLIIAILGVLVISGEYSSGMIKSTLTAAPGRLAALGAKAFVLFVSTFVVGLASIVISFLVAVQMLSGHGLSVSLFDPLIIFPVLGAALYLGLVSVFALGVGALLRSGAGGIAAVLAALILPLVFPMLPGQWAVDAAPYLLSNAGASLFLPTDMELWQGLLVVLGWIVVVFGFAATLLKRRDA